MYFKNAFDDALAAIYFLLKRYPYHATVKKNRYEQSLFNFRLASLLKQAALYNHAEQWFLKVIKEGQENNFVSGAYFHLGEIAYLKNDFDRAHEHFSKCLENNPHHLKARAYYDELEKNICKL